MDELVVRWAVGLVVSLGGGWLAAWGALALWRPKKEESDRGVRVPPSIMGLGERFFFTLVVAFEVSGAAVAMMIWLAVKMAVNWNRLVAADGQDAAEVSARSRGAIAALFAGLASMTFALIGGLICAGRI